MDIDLTGRRAFVSGSTQGIGRVIAARLAAAGAATTINGRDLDRVDAVVAQLRDELPGARIDGVAADLATVYGARELFDVLPDVDVLVNNLGIFAPQPVLEIDDDTWQRFWEVNVMSAIRLSRHYVPGMRDRGWGRVQFMASDSAVVIPAEMVQHRPNSLIQRLIEPEEIANMVVYLSSEQASATTGGALRVDGGYVDYVVP